MLGRITVIDYVWNPPRSGRFAYISFWVCPPARFILKFLMFEKNLTLASTKEKIQVAIQDQSGVIAHGQIALVD